VNVLDGILTGLTIVVALTFIVLFFRAAFRFSGSCTKGCGCGDKVGKAAGTGRLKQSRQSTE